MKHDQIERYAAEDEIKDMALLFTRLTIQNNKNLERLRWCFTRLSIENPKFQKDPIGYIDRRIREERAEKR